MSYQLPSPTSSESASLSPSPPPGKSNNQFGFSRTNGSSPQHVPSTPERRSLDPIPSTTPLGPPPSTSKSLLFTASSHRPGGLSKTKETPPSQAPRFFNTHAGNAPREALFGKPAVGVNGLGSGITSSDHTGQKSQGNGAGLLLKSSPPSMPPPKRLVGNTGRATRGPVFGSDRDKFPAEDESLANISPGAGYGFLDRSTVMNNLPDLMGESGAPQDVRQMTPLAASGKKRARTDFDTMPVTNTNAGIYAKGYAATHPPEVLTDSDQMVLHTESLLVSLKSDGSSRALDSETRAGIVAGEVLKDWVELSRHSDEGGAGLALVLAALFLPLFQSGGHWNSLRTEKMTKQKLNTPIPLPEALIGWLAKFHAGGIDILDEVIEHQEEGYALAETFWDAVLWSVTTGRLSLVVKLLKGAEFTEHHQSKYSPLQLDHIEQGIECVLEMLETSPTLVDDDWDMRGPAWAIHRLQIEKTKVQLLQLRLGTESAERKEDEETEDLDESARPLRESLPRPIYQALVDLCDVMLGNKVPILTAANDWVEAVLGLTIWWDGEETLGDEYDYFLNASLSGSARNSKRGKPPRHQTRPVDVTPNLAYRQRIAQIFQLVLAEEQFSARGGRTQVDFSDPLEIGLSCLFEGDMDGALSIISTSSMCIAAAIIRIASTGGWLAESMKKPRALLDLTNNDLLVLSYAGGDGPNATEKHDSLLRDQLIARYAMLLTTRRVFDDESFHGPDSRGPMPGWELGLAVLADVEDKVLASQKATAILDAVPMRSVENVNNVVAIADALGFVDLAAGLAEKHADALVYSRTNYGEAIICYARSRRVAKLKQLAQSLVNFSLVQSAPYPSDTEMDDALKVLTTSPQSAVDYATAVGDTESAYHFVNAFGGYCALRNYYHLRDSQSKSADGGMEIDSEERKDDLERTKGAGAALVELVNAAVDNVDGIDAEESDALVPVEALLALLGEVLGFVTNYPSVLTLTQLTNLLSAIETVSTLSLKTLSKLEAVLSACLMEARESHPSSPPELLKRSTSGLTSGNGSFSRTGTAGSGSTSDGFSLVGSSMFHSQVLAPRPNEKGSVNGSAESSGVLVKSLIKREWDWRAELESNKGKEASKEILSRLRSLLGNEVAKRWITG